MNLNALNELATPWMQWIMNAGWQAAIVTGLAFLFVMLTKRVVTSQFRYAVLLVVLLKFVTPPFWNLATGVFSQSDIMNVAAVNSAVPGSMEERPVETTTEPWRPLVADELPDVDVPAAEMPVTEVLPLQDRDSESATLPAPTTSELSVRSCLLLAYVAGIVIFALRLATRYRALRRIVLQAEVQRDGFLFSEVARIEQRLGVKKQTEVRVSAAVDFPFVMGLWRPIIVVPKELIGQLEPDQMSIVIAHELAHVRRRDLMVVWVETLLGLVWWFHPGMWWLRTSLRQAREDCCDDVLLTNRLADPERYCETLIDAATRQRTTHPTPVALGFVKHEHPTARRIRRLMDDSVFRSAKLRWPAVVLTLLLAIVVLPGMGQEPEVNNHGGEPEDQSASKSVNQKVTKGAAREDRAPGSLTAIELITLPGDGEPHRPLWHILRWRDRSVLPQIEGFLKADNRRHRIRAALMLTSLGDKRGLPAIAAELDDRSPRPTLNSHSEGKPDTLGQVRSDRYYAAHVLGFVVPYRAAEVVPILLKHLDDSDVNSAVIYSLGKSKHKPAIQPLFARLGAPAETIGLKHPQHVRQHRLELAYALAKLGHPVGRPMLISFLSDPQWTNRRHAVEALAVTGDASAVTALINAIDDPQIEVRRAIVRTLGLLGDQRAIPHLEKLLADNSRGSTDAEARFVKAAQGALRSIQATIAIKKPGVQFLRDERGNVTYIKFNPNVSGKDLALLIGFPELATLVINNADSIGDNELSHLAAVAKLRSLHLTGTAIGGDGLGQLRSLQRLESLSLTSTPITDAGLAQLKDMTSLRSLMLGATAVGDSGLEHVRELKNLRTLHLEFCKNITSDGLAHLNQLRNLEMLFLHGHPSSGSQVDDSGIAHLADLTRLRQLGLSNTDVTDKGLLHLRALVQLSTLDLRATAVSSQGVVHLAKLPRLTYLDLTSTRVDDEAVAPLKSMSHLQFLFVRATNISESAIGELKKALPDTQIFHN